MVRLVAEVMAYPVTYKHCPSVAKRAEPALSLSNSAKDKEDGNVLMPSIIHMRTKLFKGRPMFLRFDGGFAQNLGVGGFEVYDKDEIPLLAVGKHDLGLTNNQSELLALKAGIEMIVARGL